MAENQAAASQVQSQEIKISPITQALLDLMGKIKQKARPDDYTKLTVSQTVAFIALVYEKIRNAIEYREEHLIRRAAIERILKRRLAMNPSADGEAENLLRELMWARYFGNGSLDASDTKRVQDIINKYLDLKRQLIPGRNSNEQAYLSQFLVDLLTSEIEEILSPTISQQEANFTYYIYQTLKDKVKIEDIDSQQKDTFLFVAIEKAYRKSDLSYQRYHLFNLFYKPIAQYSSEELHGLTSKLPAIFHKVDEIINNPSVDKLTRFIRKQLPPFLILFEIIRTKFKESPQILSNKARLWSEVDLMCRNKYQQIRSRLNILAFRSLIYVFVTKMFFALILEVPISQLVYGEIHMSSIAINSVAPPLLMLLIVLTTKIPNEENTKRLYLRILDIINIDDTYEKTIAFITRRPKNKRPILVFGFTTFYVMTFVVTLYLIHLALSFINFNPLSEALFIFFISVISFFSYRIKQVANEYRLTEKGGILSPIIDFFFMPILSLGKVFSNGVSKLNFFIVLFDFIIEAPFKLIIEVIEEWISFVRARKEEII